MTGSEGKRTEVVVFELKKWRVDQVEAPICTVSCIDEFLEDASLYSSSAHQSHPYRRHPLRSLIMLATESVVPIHARVVGELACQRDSYLRTLQSVVVSCERVAAAASDSKRTKKNKADSGKDGSSNGSSAGAEGMWEIEFEDTILFPEGKLSDAAVVH